jgi:hypothetical protein
MVKFRGKRLDNGKWIEGNYAEFVNYLDGVTKPGIQIIRQVPSSYDRFIPAFETELIEVIPETVGMGIEIGGKWFYEEDLFKADKSVGIIVFDRDRLRIEWTNGNPECWNDILRNHVSHGEVIGTKWDNSKLGAGE